MKLNMRISIHTAFLLAPSLLLPTSSLSYTELIHEELTSRSFNQSSLTDEDFVEGRGLSLSTEYSDSECSGVIIEVIACGSISEDGGFRSIHHFFDPQNAGIAGSNAHATSASSANWALEDMLTFNGSTPANIGAQDYSYRDARTYHYEALTASSGASARQKYAKALKALGHVIHHIQDMAQPQHVRDDLHCNLPLCSALEGAAGIPGLYDPSFYEGYTDRQLSRLQSGSLSVSGYQILAGHELASGPYVYFATPREYWVTSAGSKGMAQYTSLNFISDDTNFREQGATVLPHSSHALPNPAATTEVAVQSSALGIPGPSATMTFYQYNFTDGYNGQAKFNPRLTTLSALDPHLLARQKNRIFGFNRLNAEQYFPLLLPRAVAFGTGMLDYFFRGSLELIEPTSSNKSQWRVKNTSDERMIGEIEIVGFYEDDDRDIDGTLTNIDLDPGEESGPINDLFTINGNDSSSVGPGDSTSFEERAIIAFRGKLGSEGTSSPTNSTFNAVAGVETSVVAPPQMSVTIDANGTNPIRVNGPGYSATVGASGPASYSFSFWPNRYDPFPGGPSQSMDGTSIQIECLATGQGWCDYTISFSSYMVAMPTVNPFNPPGAYIPPPSNTGRMRGPNSSLGDYPKSLIWYLRLNTNWPN